MTMPRRCFIRPAPAATPDPQRQRRYQKLRTRLEREKAAVVRWTAHLKRACTAFLKAQQGVARLERQLARTEE
jgi:hypothetical protein